MTCYLIITFWKKTQIADARKIKKRISFSLMNFNTETGVIFSRYLNSTLYNNTFEYMFLTGKQKGDYNDEYFEIISFH